MAQIQFHQSSLPSTAARRVASSNSASDCGDSLTARQLVFSAMSASTAFSDPTDREFSAKGVGRSSPRLPHSPGYPQEPEAV